jgi:adenylate kinase family enzyme
MIPSLETKSPAVYHRHHMKIHLLGPSGAGTTTLGKALAAAFGIPHFDSDDFFWVKTDPPFTDIRPRADRSILLGGALSGLSGWVVSGSMMGWGDFLIPEIECIIYKYVPWEVRQERLAARERARYGDRILPGQEMHRQHREFMEWASRYDEGGNDMRSRQSEEHWIRAAGRPFIRLDEELRPDDELRIVLERLGR